MLVEHQGLAIVAWQGVGCQGVVDVVVCHEFPGEVVKVAFGKESAEFVIEVLGAREELLAEEIRMYILHTHQRCCATYDGLCEKAVGKCAELAHGYEAEQGKCAVSMLIYNIVRVFLKVADARLPFDLTAATTLSGKLMIALVDKQFLSPYLPMEQGVTIAYIDNV